MMNAPSISTKASTSKDDKPGKPLNSYNLFFRYQRDRILSGIDHLPITVESVASLCADKRYEYSKRQHRKTHGRIGFKDLARMISAKWKVLDPNVRDMFEARAAIEKRRHTKTLQNCSQEKSPQWPQKNSSPISSSADVCDSHQLPSSSASVSSNDNHQIEMKATNLSNSLAFDEFDGSDELCNQKINDSNMRIRSPILDHQVMKNVLNGDVGYGQKAVPTIKKFLKSQGKKNQAALWNKIYGSQLTTVGTATAAEDSIGASVIEDSYIEDSMRLLDVPFNYRSQLINPMPVSGYYNNGMDVNSSSNYLQANEYDNDTDLNGNDSRELVSNDSDDDDEDCDGATIDGANFSSIPMIRMNAETNKFWNNPNMLMYPITTMMKPNVRPYQQIVGNSAIGGTSVFGNGRGMHDANTAIDTMNDMFQNPYWRLQNSLSAGMFHQPNNSQQRMRLAYVPNIVTPPPQML